VCGRGESDVTATALSGCSDRGTNGLRSETRMGFLDKIKNTAGDLVDSAKDKVTDATGLDTDKVIDAARNVADAGQSLNDAQDAIAEARNTD